MLLTTIRARLSPSLKGFLKKNIERQINVCFCKYMQTGVQTEYTVEIGDQPHKKDENPHFTHAYMTDEMNPSNHEMRHEGLLYKLPQAAYKRLGRNKTYRMYKEQCETVFERTLMIRKPALEVIHLMKNLDLSLPVPKIILYGHLGCGKSCTLLHVMHYAYLNKYFIVNTPWPIYWVQSLLKTEIANSSHKPGRIDLPQQARDFLIQLLKQNAVFLNEYKTQFRYQWTKRESSEIGTSLFDLVRFGLARIKFADDVVGALLKEVKQLAKDGKIKVLISADGINGFYGESLMDTKNKIFKDTPYHKSKKRFLDMENISLVDNFKTLLQPDMVNAICVATVDSNAAPKGFDRDLITPNQLLGLKGFEALDPFIPIHVPEYSEKEALSMIAYLVEKKWIINPIGKTEEGIKQIMFLSNKNPRQLIDTCKAL